MANCILEFNNVSIEYYGGYIGCSNINFTVDENQTVCVLGSKNSGKSSLMKAIAGLDEYGGSIAYNSKELRQIPIKERGFALTMNKLPKKSKVYKILAYPMKLRKFSKSEIQNKIIEIAKKFEITNLLDHSVSMLTPPQKVLVEIARIFMLDRSLYLIDNPLESIYTTERACLAAEIIAKIKSLNKTVIFSTDMIEEAAVISPDKIVLLCYNQMHDEGSLYDMANMPKSLAEAKFLWQDMISIVDGKIVGGKLILFGKEYGAPLLISDKFCDVKCLIGHNAIEKVKDGDIGRVLEVYKYIDKLIFKLETEIGALFLKERANADIKIGDKICYKINKDKILIYDSNSEKIIIR